MKKALSILAIFVLLFTGCSSNAKIVGKYYLEDSGEAYIEIKNDNEITFYNVDFSEIEADLLNMGIEIDVAANLSNIYDTNVEHDRLYVEIIGAEIDGFPINLTLRYSSGDKSITLSNKVYYKA